MRTSLHFPRIWILVFAILDAAIAGDVQADELAYPPKELGAYLQFANLGMTVNKPRGKLGQQLFTDEILQSRLSVVHTLETQTRYRFVQNTEEAKDMLGVSGSLGLDLKFGAVKISASGKGSYMRNVGSHANKVELMFVAHQKQRYEAIKEVETLLTKERCNSAAEIGGTHVITGVTYGASCILSCKSTVTSAEEASKITAKIKASLDVMKFKVDADGKFRMGKKAKKALENMTVTTYCNANLLIVPTNFEDAINAVTSALKNMYEQNKVGVPIEMELTPLQRIPMCRTVPDPVKNPVFYSKYLDAVDAMIVDLQASIRQLQKCIGAHSFAPDLFSLLVRRIRRTNEEMKNSLYNLKSRLVQFEKTGGISDYAMLEFVYTDTHERKQGRVQSWNYRYWEAKVHGLCKEMRRASFFPPLVTTAVLDDQLRFRVCGPTNDRFDFSRVLITDHASDRETADKAIDGNKRTCFRTAASTGGRYWVLRLSNTRIPREVEIHFFDSNRAVGTGAYISEDPKLFSQKTFADNVSDKKLAENLFGSKSPFVLRISKRRQYPVDSVLVIGKPKSAPMGRLEVCEVEVHSIECKFQVMAQS